MTVEVPEWVGPILAIQFLGAIGWGIRMQMQVNAVLVAEKQRKEDEDKRDPAQFAAQIARLETTAAVQSAQYTNVLSAVQSLERKVDIVIENLARQNGRGGGANR